MTEMTETKTTIPANAKQPEDHKAPAEETEVPHELTITVRGLELTVMSDALDDFELLDDLNELEQNENPGRLPSLMKRLVGDQWKKVMEHLRGSNGRVSVEDGSEFIGEVLEALNPNS